MINDKNKQKSEKELNSKLDNFLNKKQKECQGDDCLINNPEEIVKRENKKIITNDGRQLLNEYTN
jgi:hypothetical protein